MLNGGFVRFLSSEKVWTTFSNGSYVFLKEALSLLTIQLLSLMTCFVHVVFDFICVAVCICIIVDKI